MKKITLIILLLTFFSLTVKAQHFGVGLDVGKSWLSGVTTNSNEERSGQLFYGVGLIYNKQIKESKWGINSALDFNKRGNKIVSSVSDESTFVLGGSKNYFLSEDESTYSNYALTLSILPAFKILEKLSVGIGPHYTYSFGPKFSTISKYYKTDVNGNNKELLNEYELSVGNNGLSFIDKSYFGIKATLIYEISGNIDLGISYQYARPFKSNAIGNTSFYNVLNITTNIYFKSRKNADKN